MTVRELQGVWTPLPLLTDAPERIRGRDLIFGSAGAFFSVCEAERAPWIRFGHWDAGAWDWSPPWTIPPPPDDDGAPSRWNSHLHAVDSVEIDVDRLDPMRLAINRTEYQGGSHGIVVGRWGETFDEIPSPTDSDIRFGQPIVLRGDELWSHDMSSLWYFRRVGGSWAPTETDCLPYLDPEHGELGWHADISPSGDRVFLDLFDDVAVFDRRPGHRDDQLHFAWLRTLGSTASVLGLRQTPDGLVVADRGSEDTGSQLVLYDESLRPIWRWALESRPTPTSAAIEGHRVVAHCDGALLVHDLRSASVSHRLTLPDRLLGPRGHALNGSIHLHGDRVYVATDVDLGVYELS